MISQKAATFSESLGNWGKTRSCAIGRAVCLSKDQATRFKEKTATNRKLVIAIKASFCFMAFSSHEFYELMRTERRMTNQIARVTFLGIGIQAAYFVSTRLFATLTRCRAAYEEKVDEIDNVAKFHHFINDGQGPHATSRILDVERGVASHLGQPLSEITFVLLIYAVFS